MKKLIFLWFLISFQSNATPELSWPEISIYLDRLAPLLSNKEPYMIYSRENLKRQFLETLDQKKSFFIDGEKLSKNMQKNDFINLGFLIADILNKSIIEKIRIINFNDDNGILFIDNLFDRLVVYTALKEVVLCGNSLPSKLRKFTNLKSLNLTCSSIILTPEEKQHFEAINCNIILKDESTESLEECSTTESLEQTDDMDGTSQD